MEPLKCRGAICDNTARCEIFAKCTYKSSSQLMMEEAQALESQLEIPGLPEPLPLTSKPSNPKDIIGSGKVPLSLAPATAIAMMSIGMLNGVCKYGRDNFRAIGIRSSIYVDAAYRHLTAWYEGEECDPDDGVPHLAAALACIAIIVDAKAADKMIDDRKVAGGYHALLKELTPHVNRLKELHGAKHPKHYTIADTP